MSTTAQHAMHGLLCIGGYDNSRMTSGARPNIARGYVSTPTFQMADREGVVGQREASIACEGYFKKEDLGQVEAILDRAITQAEAASMNLHLLYAPYGPEGAASIGQSALMMKVHQVGIAEGGNVNGVVMLNQTYVANGGARNGVLLHVHTGATSVSSNETQQLTFILAPAQQEFSLRAFGSASQGVITPSMTNAQVKAVIEALTDYVGLTATVTGMDALTGTTFKSGTATVVFSGSDNVPMLAARVSESQTLTLTNALVNGTWATATITPGDSAATVQAALRALADADLDSVIVTGSTTAITVGDVTISGATGTGGGDTAVNGVYVYQGTFTNGLGGSAAWWKMADDSFHIEYTLASGSGSSSWQLRAGGTAGSGTNTYHTTGGPSLTTCPTTGWTTGGGSDPLTVVQAANTGGAGTYTAYLPYSVGNKAQLSVSGTGYSAATVTQGTSAATTLVPDTVQEGGDLRTYTLRSASFNGTTVDMGAARTRGAVAHLHAPYVSGDPNTRSLIVKIQDSSDGSTGWATIITFDTLTDIGSDRQVLADGVAVRRYVRAIVTSGQITGTWAFTVALSQFA